MILRHFFSYDTQWVSSGYNLLDIMGKNKTMWHISKHGTPANEHSFLKDAHV
jgi:hypothetical protein